MRIPSQLIALLLLMVRPGPHASLYAQRLSFTYPALLSRAAGTDKAVDITQFKGAYFLAWKQAGIDGLVHVSYLGRQYDTASSHYNQVLQNQQTAFSPVFRVIAGRIYLLWIAPDGTLRYILNKDDTSFDDTHIHIAPFTDPFPVSGGITTADIGGKLLIAAHATDRNTMVYDLIEVQSDGLLAPSRPEKIPGCSSADYPFVVGISDTIARFSWRGYKDQGVYYADYNNQANSWSRPILIKSARTGSPPAIYHLFNSDRLFYIWKGPGHDTRLYYATGKQGDSLEGQNNLPAYFSTNVPVSICNVDDNHFIMAQTGTDQRVYLSYFSNYNPGTWMEDILMPAKGDCTLQDIVLPGSHDAGMSVLTATGGMQAGTINTCNTLTQVHSISRQLQAGIRMFDLRVGVYQGVLYTKHSSSDCMDSAMGGGYGEKLSSLLGDIRQFLQKSRGEIVLLTFSHFCPKEISLATLADSVTTYIGRDLIYHSPEGTGGPASIKLRELAGKAIVTFDGYNSPDSLIHSCSTAEISPYFINFRRAYAATNQIDKLISREASFFQSLDAGIGKNDLVRLDWQLTQSPDEAAMICNGFQDEKTSPIVSGVILLTNVVRRHQNIISLSLEGNKYLPSKVNQWIIAGTINRKNKPNILYVDAAGEWITDFCVMLDQTSLYHP